MIDTKGLTEPEIVAAIIRHLGCSILGNWDGCCCSRFSIRNVDVDISCGKGGEQAIWVSSHSLDYENRELLRPIMAEVVKQVTKNSGRGGAFSQYYTPWERNAKVGQ